MKRPAVLGLVAVAVLLAWQFLTVHYNYGGNWSGLFCIAPHMPVPDFLKSERLYIFQGSAGYDGQIYHLVAHDPWLRRGSAGAIVGPAAFYQRILVPALAWSLALGQDRFVHAAYDAVELAFTFLGVYWLAQFAAREGMNPAWGLAFLITPATITSIDRMTVDVALAALTVAFALWAGAGPRWKVIAVLVLAALTKEQALPMIAGYALYLLTRKRVIDALSVAAAALPAVAWYVYVASRTPRQHFLVAEIGFPFAGLVDAVLHPASYALSPFENAAGVLFDYVALAGFLIALVWLARMAIRREWDATSSATYGLAAAASLIRNPVLWSSAYAFGRGFTPWFLLIALRDFARRPWLALAPMLLVDSRIGLNLISQIAGVARGIAGF